MNTAGALTEKPEYLVGVVHFEKKIRSSGRSQYEPEEFGHFVTYVYHVDDDAEAVIAKAVDAALEAKAVVYRQLGINYEIDEGVAREVFEDAFPGLQVVSEHPITANVNQVVEQSAVPPAGHVSPEGQVGANPPHDPKPLAKPRSQMTELEKAMARENESWAKARLMTRPDEFYDNREQKNAPGGNKNWPDFKHKAHNIGVWTDRKSQ